MYMTPYESPIYFILLLLALIPLIIQLKRGKKFMWYQNLITVFFLYISFGGPGYPTAIALIMYLIWQILLITGYFHYRKSKNSTVIFYLAVLMALLPLIIVKIIPFIKSLSLKNPSLLTTNNLDTVASLVGFLGISYLTFKSVQMVMDIRDEMITDYQARNFFQFLIFFPTISSGPIDRYERFEEDLLNVPDKKTYDAMLYSGVHMIYKGLLYKFILAILIDKFLLVPFQEQALAAGGLSWPLVGVMYSYTLYLFFDFAGYSLFAVGTSRIMGYDTPINFNKPFISHNIKDFWERWHISLSTWFRDYVYMRLMMTLLKKRVFKSRIVTSNIGYFVLFLLMAIWHGITWYYLVYGLYHASLICLTDWWIRFKRKNKRKKKIWLPSNKLTHVFAIFLTFNAVAFGLLLFSGFLDKLL
ncbi:D-alanyl-lipoteichoic acid biosynthesis protein DltB [Vagococcus sp. PNs007]|uniref:Teichoic acid D-alanyltransferase n=1 Tax=Vagococcus proximus TaxID=2991417 RepID=A0ABT5X0N7_9ENTE|nr:D-alanyl-lipoteichoic acid biosynthesis protein DltB [Vagococcus proximus]MDF0479563.1 D-alanyl-lipoteichoic acid biosynthesis protein DltB [Vagococcus proximus]